MMSRIFIHCFCCLLMISLWQFPLPMSADEPTPQEDLENLMQVHNLGHSTAQLTPTVCELWGLPKPDLCIAKPIPEVIQFAEKELGETKLQKTLVFCPDAIGKVQVEKYPEEFKPLIDSSDYVSIGANVMPTCTPVNFATIFSGAPPISHGIRKYSKPVLKIQTLFDIFSQAGKKTAIVASADCSMGRIFLERKIDYFFEDSPETSFQKACQLIKDGDYSLIVCYDGGYDSTMHATGVYSPQSYKAMTSSIRRYLELVKLTDSQWQGVPRMTIFAPDHGSHDLPNGKGTHGSNSAEDSIVEHFYRLRGK